MFLPPMYEVWDKVLFSQVSFNILGGYPIQLMGVPIPCPDRGYPKQQTAGGGTPFQVLLGVPHQAGGTPSQVQVGGTPSSWWGVPHSRSIRRQQHSKHLLCSGWYASCIHTGVLSSVRRNICVYTFHIHSLPIIGTPSSWLGVPHSRSKWVVPHPVGGGYPIPGPGRGYPISGLDGVPPNCPGLDGDPPSIRRQQHSEHLLRSRQYASCIHAGGLSCVRMNIYVYTFHIHSLPIISTANGATILNMPI